MNKTRTTSMIARYLLLASLTAMLMNGVEAKIPEPDHVFYGNASWYGAELAAGTRITLQVAGQEQVIASYSMGSDPAYGPLYVLRVPMDSLSPRDPGTARPGEQASIHIDGLLAAAARIGEFGETTRLDIDPNDLEGGGPNIAIDDLEVYEGHSGQTPMSFTLSLSTTHSVPVSVDWATRDGTATGGALCSAGIDYIADGGTANIEPGALSAPLTIKVCGERVDEADETFFIDLANAVDGHLSDDRGDGAILDDDTFPGLTINDITVIEPPTGSVSALFTVSLSEVSEDLVSFDYHSEAISAASGFDFTAVSGSISIAPGDPRATIAVPVVADLIEESNEEFRVVLSNGVGADIIDSEGVAVIVDPATQPAHQLVDTVDDVDDNIANLLGPTSVAISPDGRDLYVGARSADTLLHFSRAAQGGKLTLIASYDVSSSGFSDAAFDGISDVLVSPDGKQLYVTAFNSDAVNIIGRNATDGSLLFQGAYLDNDALNGATAVAISPDGKHLYVAASSASAISAFSRNSGNGQLTWLKTVRDGENGVDGIAATSALALSHDGNDLYATGSFDNAVAHFQRDGDPLGEGYGTLEYVARYRDNLAGVDGIAGASAVVVSRDGENVYVAGENEDAIAVFSRNPDFGILTWQSVIRYGDEGVAGMLNPQALGLSADDQYLYALGYGDHSVVVFVRSSSADQATNGDLSAVENIINGYDGVSGLRGPTDIAITADDGNVYITAFIDNSVAILNRLAEVIFTSSFE